MTWTDAKIATISRMWAEGYTSTVIGTQVGKSRNAVIGKLGRMGLIGDPDSNRNRALIRTNANRKRKEVRQRTAAPVEPPKPKPAPVAKPVNPDGILITDLTNTTCRWPVHDTLPGRYCGAHTDAGSYCEHHTARAYRVPG